MNFAWLGPFLKFTSIDDEVYTLGKDHDTVSFTSVCELY